MQIVGIIFDIISGVTSLASCILAFYVFFNFDKVKLKIEKQAKNYKEEHNEIKDRLKVLRAAILSNPTIETRSEFREELHYIKNKYKNLLNKKYTINKINTVIELLVNENFDKEVLCAITDEIIAKFRSDEP